MRFVIQRPAAVRRTRVSAPSPTNPTYREADHNPVGDDACDIPSFSAISNLQAEQIFCRGRRLDDPRFPINTKLCNQYSDSITPSGDL